MDVVDRIKRDYAAQFLGRWRGLQLDAAEALQVYGQMTHAEAKRLDAVAQKLAEHLQSDGDQKTGTWSKRIAQFQTRLPDRELMRLACLSAGLGRATPKTAGGALEVLERQRRTAKERLVEATDFQAWATDMIEGYQVLPPSFQGAIVAGASPELVLEKLAVLLKGIAALPPPAAGLLRDLSTSQGQELARYALTLLEGDTLSGTAMAEELLEDLACAVPDALQGLHLRLVDFPNVWRLQRGVVFRGADAATRDRLLQMADTVEDVDGYLKALAWIGDEVVQAHFQKWRAANPYVGRIYVSPEMYSYEAGWELTAAGDRRQLYFDPCFELITREEGSAPGPVAVATPRDDRCGHCGHPLMNLLDVDLHDPRMAFLRLSGRQLRLLSCPTCYERVFSTFDTNGKSAWSPHSDPPSQQPEAFTGWYEDMLALGCPGRTPVESLRVHSSWLGGHPNWINDPAYPECPSCRQRMTFVAQVDLDSLGGNGCCYAFVCSGCRMAATEVHCT